MPNLRVTLDRLLGEHALLAIEATRRGYDGARAFNAAAALDRNSVELAGKVIVKQFSRRFGS